MNRIKRLVVGVDFSECSRSALRQAVRLAREHEARLLAVHIVEYFVLSDLAWASHTPQDELEKEAVEKRTRLLSQWLKSEGAPEDTRSVVEVGMPLDRILHHIAAAQADLLVLGVNGVSMIPPGAGALATKCLRKALNPVLLVHERHPGPMRRILVGVDFSDPAREAVRQAVLLAKRDGAELHGVHVFTGSWGRHALVPDSWEVEPEKAAHYRGALRERVREFAGDTEGVECRFEVVESSNHGHGLAEYARQAQVDLVVLGTTGRSNLAYVLLGSTVERLLRDIPCSVLAVRRGASAGEKS